MQPGELYNLQGCKELQKSINYLTFSDTTVSTSIRFPRSSLPRLVNLVHTAVLECCTKFSTRVLNLDFSAITCTKFSSTKFSKSKTWYSSTKIYFLCGVYKFLCKCTNVPYMVQKYAVRIKTCPAILH